MAAEKPGIHRRTLQHAARILGGKEKLRAYLQVSMPRLEAWLAGEEAPLAMSLAALDLIDARQTYWLQRSSAEALRTSQDALGKSRRILDDVRHRSSGARAGAARQVMIGKALDAAIDAAHADMGNVQLADGASLSIFAQRGFERPFLDFFAFVSADGACACGQALSNGARVVIADVASDPLFAGTPAGAAMADAGARAVQSTPLRSAKGAMLGVLSTHWRESRRPSVNELQALDRIARRIAFWLAPGAISSATARVPGTEFSFSLRR